MKKLILMILVLTVACAPQTTPLGEVATLEPTATLAPEVEETVEALDLSDPKSEWNLLMLGSDFRAGDPNRQNPHTDSITIVNVQEFESFIRVTYMAIPRDLWLGEHGIANSVYYKYGFAETTLIFGDAFGLEIDAVLYVDMESFANFVDAIGGVRFEVPVTVRDKCGSDHLRYDAGQVEVFPGYDFLCLARVRKGYDDGFLTRQLVHADMLQALYEQMIEQVIYDPVALADAAVQNPFIHMWPFVEVTRLGKLVLRSTLAEVRSNTVSLAPPDVEVGTEVGPLADGTTGEYFVHRPVVNLQEWFQCAIGRCD